MNAMHRWTRCLLCYHLILVAVFLLFGRLLPTTHWTGCLLAFGLPTVQFTWSFTVAFILGPGRKYRRWYWSALLLAFIPLSFVRIACMLAYHFVGVPAALICLAVCLAVLILETYAGILYGVMAHSQCRSR